MVCELCFERINSNGAFIKLCKPSNDVCVYHCFTKTENKGTVQSIHDNRREHVYLVHNPKGKQINRENLLNKIDQKNAGCLFCKFFYRHTKELLKKVELSESVTLSGICDHCKNNPEFICSKCEDIKRQFLSINIKADTGKQDKIKKWLLTIKNVLEIQLKKQEKVRGKSLPSMRSFSEPFLPTIDSTPETDEPIIENLMDDLGKYTHKISKIGQNIQNKYKKELMKLYKDTKASISFGQMDDLKMELKISHDSMATSGEFSRTDLTNTDEEHKKISSEHFDMVDKYNVSQNKTNVDMRGREEIKSKSENLLDIKKKKNKEDRDSTQEKDKDMTGKIMDQIKPLDEKSKHHRGKIVHDKINVIYEKPEKGKRYSKTAENNSQAVDKFKEKDKIYDESEKSKTDAKFHKKDLKNKDKIVKTSKHKSEDAVNKSLLKPKKFNKVYDRNIEDELIGKKKENKVKSSNRKEEIIVQKAKQKNDVKDVNTGLQDKNKSIEIKKKRTEESNEKGETKQTTKNAVKHDTETGKHIIKKSKSQNIVNEGKTVLHCNNNIINGAKEDTKSKDTKNNIKDEKIEQRVRSKIDIKSDKNISLDKNYNKDFQGKSKQKGDAKKETKEKVKDYKDYSKKFAEEVKSKNDLNEIKGIPSDRYLEKESKEKAIEKFEEKDNTKKKNQDQDENFTKQNKSDSHGKDKAILIEKKIKREVAENIADMQSDKYLEKEDKQKTTDKLGEIPDKKKKTQDHNEYFPKENKSNSNLKVQGVLASKKLNQEARENIGDESQQKHKSKQKDKNNIEREDIFKEELVLKNNADIEKSLKVDKTNKKTLENINNEGKLTHEKEFIRGATKSTMKDICSAEENKQGILHSKNSKNREAEAENASNVYESIPKESKDINVKQSFENDKQKSKKIKDKSINGTKDSDSEIKNIHHQTGKTKSELIQQNGIEDEGGQFIKVKPIKRHSLPKMNHKTLRTVSGGGRTTLLDNRNYQNKENVANANLQSFDTQKSLAKTRSDNIIQKDFDANIKPKKKDGYNVMNVASQTRSNTEIQDTNLKNNFNQIHDIKPNTKSKETKHSKDKSQKYFIANKQVLNRNRSKDSAVMLKTLNSMLSKKKNSNISYTIQQDPNFDPTKFLARHSDEKVVARITSKHMNTVMQMLHVQAEEMKKRLNGLSKISIDVFSKRISNKDSAFRLKHFENLPSSGQLYETPTLNSKEIPKSQSPPVYLSTSNDSKRSLLVKGERIDQRRKYKFNNLSTVQGPLLFHRYEKLSPLNTISDHSFNSPSKDKSVFLPRIKKGIKYILSDKQYIQKGWTRLPTEKVVRKVNFYEMSPVRENLDWFKRNKYKNRIYYKNGNLFADFYDDGAATIYYSDGEVALEYNMAEELYAKKRYTVFSHGIGESHSKKLLACFDQHGNGIVYGNGGNVRLKYNQSEGYQAGPTLGSPIRWKWHTLNDNVFFEKILIDTYLPIKDEDIQAYNNETNVAADIEEDVLNVVLQNSVEETRNSKKDSYRQLDVKMKALKINNNFSLKILHQSNVQLIFHDEEISLILHVGLKINPEKILGCNLEEFGSVKCSFDQQPAPSESVARLQKLVEITRAKHLQEVRRLENITRNPRVYGAPFVSLTQIV